MGCNISLPARPQITKEDRQLTLGVSDYQIKQREICINKVRDFLDKHPSGAVFRYKKEISDIVVAALNCKCERTSEDACIFSKE